MDTPGRPKRALAIIIQGSTPAGGFVMDELLVLMPRELLPAANRLCGGLLVGEGRPAGMCSARAEPLVGMFSPGSVGFSPGRSHTARAQLRGRRAESPWPEPVKNTDELEDREDGPLQSALVVDCRA